MLDREVRAKFKEFQGRTGKYEDLDIDEVRFEKILLENEHYFEFIKGKNKYIQRYIKVNKGEYPILGSSLKNDCIADYIKPIDKSDIVNQKCVSFNKDNAKGSVPFFRDYPFLMDRHHIAIVPNNELVDANYLTKSLIYFFKTRNFGWGDNVADVASVQKHFVPIPKSLNEYTSLKIQEAIVEFLEDSFEEHQEIKETIDKRYKLFEKIDEALIPSTFKREYVKNAFGKYAKENDVKFDITDVEFEIKRIHSDNNDEVICKKRMGFTPKTNVNGTINWYTVGDLGQTKGLYINTPNSIKMTTMELIKQQVDKKNTGKSEKLIPIKKGDILVSFKLSVGVVKIYNSNTPLYCNEAIDILTVDSEIVDNRYVAYNCMLEYPKYGTKTNNGITLNDEDKKKIKIYIPKDLESYSSLEIQKIIADFIEAMQKKIQKEFDIMNQAYDTLERLHKAYLARTFTKIDWGEK